MSSAATIASDELPRYAPHPNARELTGREFFEANCFPVDQVLTPSSSATIISDELPQYSPPAATPSAGRGLTEHEFIESHSAGRPKKWTTLKLLSKTSSGRLPVFVGGEDITGKLEVDVPQLQEDRKVKESVIWQISDNNFAHDLIRLIQREHR
jgi:hypothetical protein